MASSDLLPKPGNKPYPFPWVTAWDLRPSLSCPGLVGVYCLLCLSSPIDAFKEVLPSQRRFFLICEVTFSPEKYLNRRPRLPAQCYLCVSMVEECSDERVTGPSGTVLPCPGGLPPKCPGEGESHARTKDENGFSTLPLGPCVFKHCLHASLSELFASGSKRVGKWRGPRLTSTGQSCLTTTRRGRLLTGGLCRSDSPVICPVLGGIPRHAHAQAARSPTQIDDPTDPPGAKNLLPTFGRRL